MTPKFKIGDTVVSLHNREVGRIDGEPLLDAGEFWYTVRFDRRRENIVEEDLGLLDEDDESIADLVQRGRWGRISAFRCALAVERLSHENRNTLYSFRSQRVLFQPHQYKPLLKLLDSQDRRLLIADEVGLGKTIEAGLILTEMESRNNVERAIVVCPSRLRDKWREELGRKFDQDFEIQNKAGVMEYIHLLKTTSRRKPFRVIISQQALRDEELQEAIEANIGHFDVAILDEAHHARNPETRTSEVARLLGRMSATLVMLTATPVHLGTRDLFTLLNAMRPSEFTDARVLDEHVTAHREIYDAAHLVRSCKTEALEEVREILMRVFAKNKRLTEPRVKSIINRMNFSDTFERTDWIDLERDVQNLHPLSDLITRTRKRDVQESAAVRRARVLVCRFSMEEENAYQALLGGRSSKEWNDVPLGFGSMQRARQAASCLPAALLAAAGKSASSDDGSEEQASLIDKTESTSDCLLTDINLSADSKLEELLKLLLEIRESESSVKVLIFSFFVGTVDYIAAQLSQKGFGTEVIHGGIPSDPRRPDRDERGDRIRRFREDPTCEVLVSSEVGSEGLDFQFCHHLVNYDLPWNPMVVEQRIGRIDRFGQKHNVLHIYNLVIEGTVEESILQKLYDRIGIFKESLGNLEAILGDIVQNIERDFISGRLTPAEADRRVQEAAFAVENRKTQARDLEKHAEELFGLEEFVRSELDRVSELGRYISETSLLAVIQSYLHSHHPDAGMWADKESGIHTLRLTPGLKAAIQSAATAGRWSDRSRKGQLSITMDGELAFREPSLELVNHNHPLLIAAREAIEDQLQRPSSRVGRAMLNLDSGDHDTFPAGAYLVVVYVIHVNGLRSRRFLETVGVNIRDGNILDGHDGERLLHLVTDNGQEWSGEDSKDIVHETFWLSLEAEIRRRFRKHREAEREYSEAYFERRLHLLNSEYERNRQEKVNRLEKVRERKRSEQIVKAFEGQIDRLDAQHRERRDSLELTREPRLRLEDPIAACLVHVRHVSGWKVKDE